MENASDPTLIKPKRRFGWFIKNAHFNAYDTLACVGNLTKSCKEGDMKLKEVLLLQGVSCGRMKNAMAMMWGSGSIRKI